MINFENIRYYILGLFFYRSVWRELQKRTQNSWKVQIDEEKNQKIDGKEPKVLNEIFMMVFQKKLRYAR